MAEGRKILLINDDEITLRYLKDKISINTGFSVVTKTGNLAGFGTFKEEEFDLVITKLGMGDLETPEFIRKLKTVDPDCIVIVLFDSEDDPSFNEVARLGVYDFVNRNANLEKIFFLVKKGMEVRSLLGSHKRLLHGLKEQNQTLQKQNTLLAKRIEESTKNLARLYEDLRSTYMRTIKVLAQAIDARDHYTHSHSEHVANIAVVIAEEMKLSTSEIERIREACELHDLGKIGVEDNILSKPSALTEEEWAQIRRHPDTAAQILEPLTFLNGVVDLVKQHHEHYDGSGYPLGIKGDQILLGARILNLADAYEAMTSARSYRKNPLTKEQAVAEIKKNSGTQFDPKVVEAFLRIVNKI